jgi:catechol 2,3-dioxygenase-like lactoylglutathione lyase family enzyme
MELGAFSVSLAVKDIHASLAFYEALGFTPMGGNVEDNWIILANGSTVIGLFQGMFEGNILTFNPGWDQAAQDVDPFTDVREIQRRLKDAGLSLSVEADVSSAGPAHVVLSDPDGNTVMIDQHR